LERPALGSPFHRECKSSFMLLFRLSTMLNAEIPLCILPLFSLTIGRGICGIRTLLWQLHQCCRTDALGRAELDRKLNSIFCYVVGFSIFESCGCCGVVTFGTQTNQTTVNSHTTTSLMPNRSYLRSLSSLSNGYANILYC